MPDGDRNGRIGGEFCDAPDSASEAVYFWRHLRLAGLIANAGNASEQAGNASGGILGVQSGTGSATAPELPGMVLCASNLSGKIAAALDAQFDDGQPQTGSARAYQQNKTALQRACSSNVTRGKAVANTTAYNAADDTELYTLCKSF